MTQIRVPLSQIESAKDSGHYHLSLNDLAEVVADAIKSSERRVLEHVGRMFKLIDVKFGDQHEKTRISNIHRRLIQVESELRRLNRK